MSIFLQNYVQLLQGANVKPLPPVITGGFVFGADGGFPVQISYIQIIDHPADRGPDDRVLAT